MRAGRLLLPLAALGLLLTSGCAGPDPEPSASGSAAAGEAFFASEEEAVEAALAVYAEYNAMADQIMADGGVDSDRLLAFATDEVVAVEESGYAVLREKGATASGRTVLDGFTLQSADLQSGDVRFYVCRDVSALAISDAAGNNLVSPDRPERGAFEVAMSPNEDSALVITEDNAWSGAGVC